MNKAFQQYTQNNRKMVILSILVFADESATLDFKNGLLMDNIKIDFPVIGGYAGGQEIIMQKYCTQGFSSPAFVLVKPDRSLDKQIEPIYYPPPNLLSKYDDQIGEVPTGVNEISNIGNTGLNKIVIHNLTNSNISFFIPKEGSYSISLYSLSGQRKELISNLFFKSGLQTIPLKLNNLAKGTYYINFTSSHQSVNSKVILF